MTDTLENEALAPETESPAEEKKLSKEERMAAFEAVLFAMGNSVPEIVLQEALALSKEELEETAAAPDKTAARCKESSIAAMRLRRMAFPSVPPVISRLCRKTLLQTPRTSAARWFFRHISRSCSAAAP